MSGSCIVKFFKGIEVWIHPNFDAQFYAGEFSNTPDADTIHRLAHNHAQLPIERIELHPNRYVIVTKPEYKLPTVIFQRNVDGTVVIPGQIAPVARPPSFDSHLWYCCNCHMPVADNATELLPDGSGVGDRIHHSCRCAVTPIDQVLEVGNSSIELTGKGEFFCVNTPDTPAKFFPYSQFWRSVERIIVEEMPDGWDEDQLIDQLHNG